MPRLSSALSEPGARKAAVIIIITVLTVTCPEVSVAHNDKDEGLEVTVELPGVSKENVELTVSKGGFCIPASREDLKYEGCFQFAHEVNSDGTKAKFESGLQFNAH